MRALLGFAAGLVALAVGTGIGPRHVAVEGLTVPGVLGLLVLAAGLAVAVWSAVRLLARAGRRRSLLVVPLMLVATYLTVWTLGQAVAGSYPPRPALGARTPSDVGLPFRVVTFPSSDGVRLAGWYVPSLNGAAVALLHGAGSTRSSVLDHAAVLAAHGYGVLLYDARGHGESNGRGMDFGWYGESDAAGAVDFLVGQADVSPDRVGLVGLSMGGEEAIGAAGADDRVAAVVAEGATARTDDDKGYLAAYGVRGRLQQGVDRVTYGLVDLLSAAPEPDALGRSVAAARSRPDPTEFLFVTGGDMPDEGLAADRLAGSAGDVSTWTVPGAGHTEGLSTSPEEWERRVVGFLDRALAS